MVYLFIPISSMFGFVGAVWILTAVRLPTNVFTFLIKWTALIDLILAITQSTLDLDSIKEWEVELTKALLDISIYLALALAYIAYAVVKGTWALEISLYWIAVLSFLPGIIHALGFYFLPVVASRALHAITVGGVFTAVLWLYGSVMWELRKLKILNKPRSFSAKDLFLRLVVSLTVVNVITWIPHIIIGLLTVNDEFIQSYSVGVLYWEKVAIAAKGAFHAAAVVFALYYDPKANLRSVTVTELEGLRNINYNIENAVTAKEDYRYKIPSTIRGYEETILDK